MYVKNGGMGYVIFLQGGSLLRDGGGCPVFFERKRDALKFMSVRSLESFSLGRKECFRLNKSFREGCGLSSRVFPFGVVRDGRGVFDGL